MKNAFIFVALLLTFGTTTNLIGQNTSSGQNSDSIKTAKLIFTVEKATETGPPAERIPDKYNLTAGQRKSLENAAKLKKQQDPNTRGNVRQEVVHYGYTVHGTNGQRITEAGTPSNTNGWTATKKFNTPTYWVQLAIFSSYPDIAPPVAGSLITFHQYSLAPNGQTGAYYSLYPCSSAEEAREKATEIRKLKIKGYPGEKIDAWYNSELTGLQLEILGFGTK